MTMDQQFPHPITRVAIIGAGPYGLAAANALRKEGTFDTIVVYERRSQVGGVWVYSPDTNACPPMPSTNCFDINAVDKQPKPQRSPVYDSLHTNLPAEIMPFRDQPFAPGTSRFPPHEKVLEYLHHYARDKGLEPLIRLNTKVIEVAPLGHGWQITSMTTGSDPHQQIETFDAVVVASGQHAVPFVPDFEGYTDAPDVKWIHSRDYRRPDSFADKTVLVVGGGFSSTDVMHETSKVAKKVYFCIRPDSRLAEHAKRFENSIVQRVGELRRYDAATKMWECADGTTFGPVDEVVFATGYMNTFPFFPMELQKDLFVDGRKVHQLYRHVFYKRNPTLVFFGLLLNVVPFVVAQAQGAVVARVWNGKIKLPRLEPDAPGESKNDRREFVLEIDQEIAYVDSMNAWAEDYQGNLDDWNSDDPVTGRLSEEFKALRRDIFDLRAKHFGY